MDTTAPRQCTKSASTVISLCEMVEFFGFSISRSVLNDLVVSDQHSTSISSHPAWIFGMGRRHGQRAWRGVSQLWNELVTGISALCLFFSLQGDSFLLSVTLPLSPSIILSRGRVKEGDVGTSLLGVRVVATGGDEAVGSLAGRELVHGLVNPAHGARSWAGVHLATIYVTHVYTVC